LMFSTSFEKSNQSKFLGKSGGCMNNNDTQTTKHDTSVVWIILGAMLLFSLFTFIILLGIF